MDKLVARIGPLKGVPFELRGIQNVRRGTALALCAHLDTSLSAALKAWLVNDERMVDETFSDYRPLGSTDARIRLGYMIGMFGKNVYADLQIVNTVRNRFAHEREVSDFDHPRVKGQIENLKIIKSIMKAAAERGDSGIGAIIEALGYTPGELDYEYVCTVFVLNGVMELLRRRRARVTKRKVFDL
jgi:hypothetical protein